MSWMAWASKAPEVFIEGRARRPQMQKQPPKQEALAPEDQASWQRAVSSIGTQLDWDIFAAYQFVLDLMEDVNAHTAAAKVKPILQSDLSRLGPDSGELT